MELSSGLEAVFRWLHVLFGILWVGHLYFFNFVNAPFAATLDAGTRRSVVPELMPRALFWFRWGAAWTWVTGLLLLLLVYYMNKAATETQVLSAGSWIMLGVTLLGFVVYDLLFKSPLAKKPKAGGTVAFVILAFVIYLFIVVGNYGYRGVLIHTGALFGTIMFFNVWYRIWPAQKKIIRAVKDGQTPDPELVKLAGLRSRHNTYMSVPLLWAMIGQHTTYFAGGNLGISGSYAWVVWLLIILLGWHVVFHLYKRAAKVR